MKRIFITYFSIFCLLVELLPPIQKAQASLNLQAAQNFLLNSQFSGNAWVTMALVATNANEISFDYLKNSSGATAISLEAPILAITSLGQDPKKFGPVDYIASLENFHNQSQLGDPTALNDDFFGILALTSSGLSANDQTIADSKKFILAHQNNDGGWGWSVSAGSDSNDTAAAIMSLVAAGLSPADSHIALALTYLKTDQGKDGGFLYDASSSNTDSSSTSWVVWALNALNTDPQTWAQGNNNPISYLTSYQNADGSFKWLATDTSDASPSITADAVIALSGKTLPLRIFNSTTQTQTFGFRIEGSQDTICAGQALGPTALDIIKNAGPQCGYAYNIQTTSYGPYLNKIGGDTASGSNGWVYLVNNVEPDVGATDYQLKPNDQVLWFFGDYSWLPTRLTLSAAQINSGLTAVATVEDFSSGSWSVLPGATVSIGTKTFTTDNSGQADIGNQDGYYQISASKNGYVRSNTILLQIGQPNSNQISLTANINPGQILGTSTPSATIAFTVNPTALDFGNLTQNAAATKSITITNTGNTDITIKSAVSGDGLFTDNLTVNQTGWREFFASVNAGQNQNEPITLTLPKAYAFSGGQKTGQLIFWASEQ
jgi:Domain of unknown function (DUF4430)